MSHILIALLQLENDNVPEWTRTCTASVSFSKKVSLQILHLNVSLPLWLWRCCKAMCVLGQSLVSDWQLSGSLLPWTTDCGPGLTFSDKHLLTASKLSGSSTGWLWCGSCPMEKHSALQLSAPNLSHSFWVCVFNCAPSSRTPSSSKLQQTAEHTGILIPWKMKF